ncbi:MAG: hypothetical protein GXX84_18015 [Acidobacteria bacterium]|nr:hypothetical protein [Acidobacteriota bacterium]
MPSVQDCAERLREQAYRTLLPQVREIGNELQKLSSSLTDGVKLLEQKLDALNHVELPTTEPVLTELLGGIIRQKKLEASELLAFARRLKTKETQEELLASLLDAVQKYTSRAALFAVRGDRFAGWSSRGFSDEVAHNLSSCVFSREDCELFETALKGESPIAAADLSTQEALTFLGEEARGEYTLVPLHVLQRPVALLVAATPGDEGSESDAISLAAEFTTLRLENVALKVLRHLSETVPERKEVKASAAAVQSGELRQAAAAQVSQPAPAPVQPVIEDAIRTPAPVETLAALAAIETPAAAEDGHGETAEPSIQTPPPVKQKESTRPPEEEKLHSEAKRFARLLVSEIKLYNENQVAEGRRNRDLYSRLKRDVDRSREMYEKRVSPSVSCQMDYFHEEIIRILGDNDPSTLGSEYPGSRVES